MKSHLATNILNDKKSATVKAKSQILSGKSEEERLSNLKAAKATGMVTEDSTLDNIVGTTGDKARKAYAIMGAGSADRDAVTMLNGKRMNTTYDASSGKALTNVDSSTTNRDGHSTLTDNQKVNKGGTRYDAAVDGEFYTNYKEKENFEKVKENTNLKNDLIRAVSSGGTLSEISSIYQSMGLSPKTADKAAVLSAAAGVALVGTELSTFVKDGAQKGFRMQKTDTSGNKLYTDPKTGIEVKQNKDGDFFMEKKDGSTEAWKGDEKDLPPQKRFRGGRVSEGGRKVWGEATDGLSKMTDKIRGISSETKNNSVDGSTNPSQQHNNSKTNGSGESEIKQSPHGNSSNKDINSIAKNGISFNSLKSFGKGFGIGMAIDAATQEVSQFALDHGYSRTANALDAVGDTVSGVYSTIMGTSVAAAGYIVGSKTIANYGKNMVNDAGQSIADAVVLHLFLYSSVFP